MNAGMRRRHRSAYASMHRSTYSEALAVASAGTLSPGTPGASRTGSCRVVMDGRGQRPSTPRTSTRSRDDGCRPWLERIPQTEAAFTACRTVDNDVDAVPRRVEPGFSLPHTWPASRCDSKQAGTPDEHAVSASPPCMRDALFVCLERQARSDAVSVIGFSDTSVARYASSLANIPPNPCSMPARAPSKVAFASASAL